MKKRPSARGSESGKTKGAASLLLEVRKKYNEVFEEAKGLRAIIDLAKDISANLDLDEILASAMNAAVALTHAERGYLVLVQEGVPRVMSSVHIDPEVIDADDMSFSKSIVLHTVNTGEAILSTNARDDDRFADAKSVQIMDLRAVMTAPIRYAGGAVIGAIYLDDPMQTGKFNAQSLKLLEGFAGQVSVAIQTAKLHEHLLKQGMQKQQMATARNIQMMMVPKAPPDVPGVDIQWKYEPAMQVGGDLIQFITMADGRQGIFIADVAGKGMPAALVMTKLHEGAKLLSAWTDDLLDFMSRINDSLVEDLEIGTMVTATLLVFNPDGLSADMIRSGHCPTGVIRGATGQLEWHEPKGIALGVDSKKWRDLHEVVRIDIGINDGILLFTDGVNEAMNAEHQEFEFERVKEFADRNASLDARSLVDGLFEAIQDFAAGAEQSDDVTIVYARKKGLSPIRNEFE